MEPVTTKMFVIVAALVGTALFVTAIVMTVQESNSDSDAAVATPTPTTTATITTDAGLAPTTTTTTSTPTVGAATYLVEDDASATIAADSRYGSAIIATKNGQYTLIGTGAAGTNAGRLYLKGSSNFAPTAANFDIGADDAASANGSHFEFPAGTDIFFADGTNIGMTAATAANFSRAKFSQAGQFLMVSDNEVHEVLLNHPGVVASEIPYESFATPLQTTADILDMDVWGGVQSQDTAQQQPGSLTRFWTGTTANATVNAEVAEFTVAGTAATVQSQTVYSLAVPTTTDEGFGTALHAYASGESHMLAVSAPVATIKKVYVVPNVAGTMAPNEDKTTWAVASNSSADASAEFGGVGRVAMCHGGRVMIVADPQATVDGRATAGAVSVFYRASVEDLAFTLVQTLVSPTPTAAALYGSQISVAEHASGVVLAVSEPVVDNGAVLTAAGKVHMHTVDQDGTVTWVSSVSGQQTNDRLGELAVSAAHNGSNFVVVCSGNQQAAADNYAYTFNMTL